MDIISISLLGAKKAPTLDSNITDYTGTIGSNATITASFTGATTYQWYTVTDGFSHIISGATSSTLTLTSVKYENAFKYGGAAPHVVYYKCRAYNEYGKYTDSNLARLNLSGWQQGSGYYTLLATRGGRIDGINNIGGEPILYSLNVGGAVLSTNNLMYFGQSPTNASSLIRGPSDILVGMEGQQVGEGTSTITDLGTSSNKTYVGRNEGDSTSIAIFDYIGGIRTAYQKPSSGSWTAISGTLHARGDIAYGNGILVSPSYNAVFTSSNNTSWTTISFSSDEDFEFSVYGGGVWVTAGRYFGTIDTVIAYSTNNWSSHTVVTPVLGRPTGLAYGNGKFIMSTTSGVFTSTDGATWNSVSTGGVTATGKVVYLEPPSGDSVGLFLFSNMSAAKL
jgi:hypothetical protein